MPRTPRLLAAVAAAVLLALVAVGCGSSSNAPAQGSADGGTAGAADGSGADDTTDDGRIRLTDSRGEVVLDEPARRVVTIEFTYTEDVLTLGVTPVGVADVDYYREYVHQDPPLPDDVVDLGLRAEPSLDRIRGLEPDLIITTTERLPQIDALEAIAPVLLFSQAHEGTATEEMRSTFTTIGRALGREEEAAAALAELDARMEEGTAAIADADLAGTEITVAQASGTMEAPIFRLFTDDSLLVETAEAIGLENAWDGPSNEWGYSDVTIEGLTEVGSSWFLPIAPDALITEFEALYGDSPVLQNLPFVTEDRVRPLGAQAWPWGGPRSTMYLVDRFVTVLTEAA